MRTFRIIVADDQSMDRSALVALLRTQTDFEVVADAASGGEAASRSKRLRPDVIVMSIQLPDQAEQLFRAVRAVARANGSENGARPLSARELDVAALIADGRSNKEIGRALGISEPTVKKHVGHILTKLRLQDRLQVGIYIVRNPLLFQDRLRER